MYFQNEPLLPRQHFTPSYRTSLAPNTPKDPPQNITSNSQAVHHNSPSYLIDQIHLQRTPTTTTISTNTLFIELPSKYKAPYSWNNTPCKLRWTTNTSTFKSLLKKLSFQNGSLLITSLNQ